MRSNLVAASAVAGLAGVAILGLAQVVEGQAGPERKFLVQEDLAIPGYQIVLAEATLAVGAREGRHSHPGTLVGRMLEGELRLEQDGKPAMLLKPGDPFLVGPGQIHEGINTGNVVVKALVTLVVEKDKPFSPAAP